MSILLCSSSCASGASLRRSLSAGLERLLTRVVQAALDALTIAAIVAGWLVVSTSRLPIPTRFFDLFVVPDIARPDAGLFAAARFAHQFAAWSIAGLAALHAAGALKHHFVDQDDVRMRMLPRSGPRAAGRVTRADAIVRGASRNLHRALHPAGLRFQRPRHRNRRRTAAVTGVSAE